MSSKESLEIYEPLLRPYKRAKVKSLRKENVRVVKSEWKGRKASQKPIIARRKRVYRGSKPSIKKKINTLKRADKAFSVYIRGRDTKCLFPGCTRIDNLQCSHYVGRATKSTRFDPDNCITLCWLHHYKDKTLGYEYQKQRKEVHGWDGQYTLFMKSWLGGIRWDKLLAREKVGVKQKAAIEYFYSWHEPIHAEQ